MKTVLAVTLAIILTGCQMEKPPQFGNAKVYTTPGSPGGVSSSKYEVTPL